MKLDISDLQSVDRVIQARAVTLEQRVDALASNMSAPFQNIATAEVRGLDGWMAMKDGQIAGLTATISGKAPIVHTHTVSDVGGLQGLLDGKADKAHSHTMSEISGLSAALANVTAGKHNHTVSEITGLQGTLSGISTDISTINAALASKVDSSKYATVLTAGLVKIGRNLTVSADGTLDATASSAWANITGKPTVYPPDVHTHLLSDVTGLNACLTTISGNLTSINNALPNLANKVHTHIIEDVVSLKDKLDNIAIFMAETRTTLASTVSEANAGLAYAPLNHCQPISTITGLQANLDKLASQAANYTLPQATAAQLGGIKVGVGLNVSAEGVLSTTGGYTLPEATISTLGGIRVGNSLIANNGTVNVDPTVYIRQLEKGTANGVASLDAIGKVPASQISAIAISDTFVVANVTERNALDASTGDVAVDLEISQTFILQKEPANVSTNWVQLLNNVACVTSVNNLTGNVELFGKDIKNNVWAINGLTGNVTLKGTDLGNNVFSLNNRTGAVKLTGADIPLATLADAGVVKPDGVTSFIDSNGTLGIVLPTANATRLGGVKVGTGLSVTNDGTLSSSAVDYEARIAGLEKSLSALRELYSATNPARPTTLIVGTSSYAWQPGGQGYGSMVVSPWANRIDPLFVFFQTSDNYGATCLILRTNIDLSDNAKITGAGDKWLVWNVQPFGGVPALVNKTGKRLTATTLAEFNTTLAGGPGRHDYTIAELAGDFKYVYFFPSCGLNHLWSAGMHYQRMYPLDSASHIDFARV